MVKGRDNSPATEVKTGGSLSRNPGDWSPGALAFQSTISLRPRSERIGRRLAFTSLPRSGMHREHRGIQGFLSKDLIRMSDAPILTEKHGHVMTITLNRPEAMNAITPHMLQDLNQAFKTRTMISTPASYC